MSSTPYADDFVDLTGWTASGMAASGGEVKASADNSTVGKLTRTHESAIPAAAANVTVRLAFDFVVDTSMTSGTQVSVSMLNSATNQGTCVYIKQGVGIVSGYYFNTPNGFGSATTLLAWGSIVNGGRYHVEWTLNPTSWFGFVSLYDPSGNLVGSRAVTFQSSVDWYNITRVVIESNSNKTSVSRFAIDPSLVGTVNIANSSQSTARYFTNVAKYSYFQADNTGVDLYVPGGGNINEIAVYLHGAGQTPRSSEATTYATGGPLMGAFLKEGALLIVPDVPASGSGGDSWGNDYGAASVLSTIAYARSIIGSAQSPIHLLCYSMGTLTGVRLFANDGLLNVKSLDMLSSVCDLAWMDQNSGFASAIETAWGISHPGSLFAAQAAFARANPIALLQANPGLFLGLALFMHYSTTGDVTVDQTHNCVAFEALLTTLGIPHKTAVRTYYTHTENSNVGDATTHMAQIKSAAYLSLGGNAVQSIGTAVGAAISPSIGGPVLQRRVPVSRIYTPKSTGSGQFGIVGDNIYHPIGVGPLTYAIELAGTELAQGDNCDSMQAPALSGGQAANATVGTTGGTDYGTNNTRLIFVLTLADFATVDDDIVLTLEFGPELGESNKIVIPIVPVEQT